MISAHWNFNEMGIYIMNRVYKTLDNKDNSLDNKDNSLENKYNFITCAYILQKWGDLLFKMQIFQKKCYKINF